MTQLQAEALRQQAFDTLGTARSKLAAGVVDLSGVEESVRSFCAHLAAMHVEQARAFSPDLEELMEEMNKLERELEAARERVRGEMTLLSQHRSAATAYGKSDAIGGPNPPLDDEDGL